ncbi:MAG: vWA domain-containing protein [Ilumatobacteraceae bacterium]
MIPSVKLDRTLVAVEVDQTVHVLLELAAPPAPVAERKAIDVVAVIDRSGSMGGDPLAAVLHSVEMLVRLLGPDDRLAVVTFDDQVDLVLPLAHHDPDQAARVLRGVTEGGSTNLSGGWLKGMEILASHGRTDAVRRIIVLTDGQANAGITDPSALTGMTKGAHQQQISTSLIGFGARYDETLLSAMADAGGGNDYWCAGPDQATAVFADEFAGLASVVAQNISVELRPTAAVDDWLVLNEYPATIVDGGVQLAMGDAYGGERRRLVAMVHLAAAKAPGVVHVADLVVRWVSTIGDVELHTVTLPVTIGVSDGPIDGEPDPEVTEQVNVLRVSRARKEANEAAARGDYDRAADALQSALPYAQAARMAPEMLHELLEDTQRLSQRNWTQSDAKRAHATMRGTTQGRKRRYDDPSADQSGNTQGGPSGGAPT